LFFLLPFPSSNFTLLIFPLLSSPLTPPPSSYSAKTSQVMIQNFFSDNWTERFSPAFMAENPVLKIKLQLDEKVRGATMLCYAVLYCAVQCCAVLCSAALYCAVLCSATLCCIVQYCIVQCCAVLYCAVLYCIVQCCAVLTLLRPFLCSLSSSILATCAPSLTAS
jgi:hypothetical protein